MPGLLIAAELILTFYPTESPLIIIFGSYKQVENLGELILIPELCLHNRREATMSSAQGAG